MKKFLFVGLFAFALSAAFAGEKDLAASSSSASSQADNRYSFMDSHLGQSVKESKHYKGKGFFSIVFCNNKRGAPGIVYCDKPSSSGDDGLPTTTLWHVDDKLAKIVYVFHQSDYAGLVRSITAKYGEPKTSTDVETQNRMGAKFTGTNHTWSNGSSTIITVEYYGQIDQSVVIVTDSVLGPELDKRLPNDDPKI
jgi:hypothetical protein